MKIKLPSSTLIEALKRAKQASFRSSLPALGCTLLEADNGKLSVTGTNLEQRISSSIETEVSSPGSCLLNCERLLAIVGRISGEVSIAVKDDHATITGSGISAKLHGLPVVDFPAESDMNKPVASFMCENFADHLSRVSFAISQEKSRYNLTGVHVREAGRVVVLEASNGQTLHIMETGAECKAVNAIIPGDAVRQIESIFAGMTVNISITERNVNVSTSQITLISKLIEGTFPNCAATIPDEIKPNMIAKSDDLLTAIEAVASGRQMMNQCRIASTNEGIEFSAEIEGGGTIRKLIEAPQKTETKTCCDWNYLREVIKAARADEAQIMINDVGPICIKSGGFTGVFMPMRVSA